jgi:hypothetical protein
VDEQDSPRPGDEVRARISRDFRLAVAKLLTEPVGGSIEVESRVTRSDTWAVRVTSVPSEDELLQEIRRLRDVAMGTPEQAADAELRSARQSLERTRSQRDSARRGLDQFLEFHHQLVDALELWTDLPASEGHTPSRHSPSYDEVLAEVRRLKALEPDS